MIQLHRLGKIGITNCFQTSKCYNYLNQFQLLSRASFSTSNHQTQILQQNPLYTSYKAIKEHAKKEQASTQGSQSQTISPLLKSLNLLDDNNNLKSMNLSNNSDYFHSELFNKILMYYVNDFINDISYKHSNNLIIAREFISRTHHMLIKTSIGGKNNRGLLHVISLLYLREFQGKSVSTIDLHNSLTIALCIEALQSFYLVMDDIVDGSETRRGQPAWYKWPNVGLKAVNDGPMIESWVFWMINNRLLTDQNTINSLDSLFREVNILTEMGQAIDLETIQDGNKLKQVYTIERYETISMYKTSFYTFYLPYASALYLTGYDDKKEGNDGLLRNELQNKLRNELNDDDYILDDNDNVIDDGFLFHICRQISIDLGIKFQIDDDYLDRYGDEIKTGKKGTDIEDFKCSWMMVKALEICNDKQYELLKKHYGKQNKTDVDIVAKIYDDLGLKDIYWEWEEKAHTRIINTINQVDGILPTKMFTDIMNKLHKRDS